MALEGSGNIWMSLLIISSGVDCYIILLVACCIMLILEIFHCRST